MKYYDEENLLPEEFDRKMRHEFLEMVEEEDNKRNIQYLSKIKKAQEKEFEEILSIID